MVRAKVAAAALAALMVSPPMLVSAASAADWAQLGVGPAHNGFQRTETVLGPGTVGQLRQIWMQRMNVLWGSPAVVGNRVFMGVRVDSPSSGTSGITGRLVVRTVRAGRLVWRRALDRPGYLSYPAVANGVAYITTQYWSSDDTGGTLYAFDAAGGRLLWKKTGNALFSSPTVTDGMVFVAGGRLDATIWAYDAATGQLRWKTSEPVGFHVSTTTAPTVASGRLFLEALVTGSSGIGSVIALDEHTGALLWRSTLPDGDVESHLVVGNGLVIAPAAGMGVYALDAATGDLRWSYTPEHVSGADWAAIAAGTVYVTYNGTIPDGHSGDIEAALNLSDGTVRWTHVLPSPNVAIWGSPSIANGVVYVVGGFLNQVVELRTTTGALLHTTSAPAGVLATPVVANGSVYLASSNHALSRFSLSP